jgi:hypothetical protein
VDDRCSCTNANGCTSYTLAELALTVGAAWLHQVRRRGCNGNVGANASYYLGFSSSLFMFFFSFLLP